MRRAPRPFFPLQWGFFSRKRFQHVAHQRPRSVRPRLEQLEDRITPTGSLAFVQQPGNPAAGATMPSVTVAIEDQFGNIQTSYNSDTITLAL